MKEKTIELQIVSEEMDGTVILKNETGDTFTIKSEEFNDFLYGAKEIKPSSTEE
jgi:hypothetical protein